MTTTTTVDLPPEIATPVDAVSLADELAAHMMRLARLDARPRTNAVVIESTRRAALECAETLAAYLVGSDTFGGL
jgi:hypothetical protein